MTFDIWQLLQQYMLPVAIAVPVAILLAILGARHIHDLPRECARAQFVPPAAAKPRILVADDSAVARARLRKLFESQGYVVETANDGVEALTIIGGSRFSVLVTDLEMPNLDGFQLIAAVQGSMETEDIPIIAITGHSELQARVNDLKGLFGIFSKPWNDRELLKRVETLATLRRMAAPARA